MYNHLNTSKVKLRSGFLFICILISCNLFSQDSTAWKINVIDSVVSVNVPGDLKISMPVKRFTVGKLEYEQIIFGVLKIDVLDTVPLPKDTIKLRDGYDKVLKGFMKSMSGGILIGQEEIKQGKYIGRYAKIKMNKGGVDYYIESKTFFLNEDNYGIQIIYPISIEKESESLRKRFLNSLIIAATVKQVN